jgi:hypothetical protein
VDCIGFAQEQVEKSSGAENNLWIPYNDGKRSSGCTTGGLSSGAHFH